MIGKIFLALFNAVNAYHVGGLLVLLLFGIPIFLGSELILFGMKIDFVTILEPEFEQFIYAASIPAWLVITAYTHTRQSVRHGWRLSLKLAAILSLTTPLQMLYLQEFIGVMFKDGVVKSLALAWLFAPQLILLSLVGITCSVVFLIIARMIKIDTNPANQPRQPEERIEPTL